MPVSTVQAGPGPIHAFRFNPYQARKKPTCSLLFHFAFKTDPICSPSTSQCPYYLSQNTRCGQFPWSQRLTYT